MEDFAAGVEDFAAEVDDFTAEVTGPVTQVKTLCPEVEGFAVEVDACTPGAVDFTSEVEGFAAEVTDSVTGVEEHGSPRIALQRRRTAVNQLPIACTLSEADLARRQEEIRQSLTARAREAVRTGEGVRFVFEPYDGLLETIARLVDAERRCCPFLSFSVSVEPGFGPVRLEISGPPEAQGAIDQFFPTR